MERLAKKIQDRIGPGLARASSQTNKPPPISLNPGTKSDTSQDPYLLQQVSANIMPENKLHMLG